VLTKFFKQDLVEVLIAMIKAKLALFQMQQKGMLGHAGKLVEATFGEAPERLNAVNMGGTLYELVVAVVETVTG
jgi:hypothetical protein